MRDLRVRSTAISSKMLIWQADRLGDQRPATDFSYEWPPHPSNDASVWIVNEMGGGTNGTDLFRDALVAQGSRIDLAFLFIGIRRSLE